MLVLPPKGGRHKTEGKGAIVPMSAGSWKQKAGSKAYIRWKFFSISRLRTALPRPRPPAGAEKNDPGSGAVSSALLREPGRTHEAGGSREECSTIEDARHPASRYHAS